MKIFLEIILACYLATLVSTESYRYEKMHRFGLGKRIPNFHNIVENRKAYAYPQPLPTSATKESSVAMMRQPYPSLYQGIRNRDDRRVFRKEFSFPPTPVGQRIVAENMMDCTITLLSIETKESIPIILRGGAGYRHFTVVVRAKPWEPLEGTIRAYCRRIKPEY